MSRRHHHHMQPYDYDRFTERDRDRDRDQARGIEYQDDSLSSINSDEDSYLHHTHTNKEKKSNFYTKTESKSKPEKSNDAYHQDMKKQSQYTATTTASSNTDPTLERLTRLESLIEELVKKNNLPVETPTSSNAPEKSTDERRGQFNLEPRRRNFTTSMWINKIQETSIQNNWDEKTTVSYMGSQMSGIVKAWYKSLPSYDYTWPEWKILITKMFPDNTDFVTSLKRLVTRLKQADENMITYYFSKMYLIEACKITGEDAVSCLIDGLNNQIIQEQAKAHNFLTPETLYSQFLTVLPEYTVDYSLATTTDPVLNQWYYPHEETSVEENPEIVSQELFEFDKDSRTEDFDYRTQGNHDGGTRSVKTPSKRTAPVHTRLDKRFIRPNFRHQNKIPMAAKVCTICMNRGHLARNCRKADKMMYCKMDTKPHVTHFYKDCTIDGHKLRAFVDTGCTTVTIKEEIARFLKLKVMPSDHCLEVYGGGSIPVLGETEVFLEVDAIRSRIGVAIVADHVQEVEVVIGQPFLNLKDVCVILQNETLKFLRQPVN